MTGEVRMCTETDPDYMTADNILEDGDSRWYRQRIARALKAEREVCAKIQVFTALGKAEAASFTV